MKDIIIKKINVTHEITLEHIAWALWYYCQNSKHDAPPPSEKWVFSFLREQMREFGCRNELLMGEGWEMAEEEKEEALKAAKALLNL